jgi:hypothetical protein
MKKPRPGSSQAAFAAYAEWVRAKLKDWDPADDRGGPAVYVPRYNGVKAVPNHPLRGGGDIDHDEDQSD